MDTRRSEVRCDRSGVRDLPHTPRPRSEDDELKRRVEPPQIVGVAGDDATATLSGHDHDAGVHDVRRGAGGTEVAGHAGTERVQWDDLAVPGPEELR